MLGFSVHHGGGEWLDRRQQTIGSEIGALVKALRILLDLLDCLSVLAETGAGFVEEQKVIVPFA